MSARPKPRIAFGAVVRFRALEGDAEILEHAAARRGQTISAYLRDAAMAQALSDIQCDTREAALRKIRPRVGPTVSDE